jgi:RNA polymerase sigma factor (sigma-70 family)
MRPSSLVSFIGRLRRLVEPSAGGLEDAELLERVAAQRDEAAFEVLLWRYGPLVLRVCRRTLRREQDVEDAFQATFLTLARKAGSIARREALGGWLHQVAYRIGLRARARAERDGILDQERVERAAAPIAHDADGEWREVLDKEVQRLPNRYRTPFILYYLEGKTHAEAARLLACAPGTIASRLAWARERLRARLTASGLTFPAALGSLFVPAEGDAASLAALIATALRTGRLLTTGPLPGAEAIPAHVTAWSKGVVRAMFLSKVQVVATLVLASVLIGAGGVLWQRVKAGGDEPGLSNEPAAVATAQSQQKPKIASPSPEPKAAGGLDVKQLQEDLVNAEDECRDVEEEWERRIADFREQLRKNEQERLRLKTPIALDVRRKSRALELAESRLANLTQAMDQTDSGDGRWVRLQKNAQEAKKQLERLSDELLKSELKSAELDEHLGRETLEIGSMERQRALEVRRARRRVEAIEQKLQPAAGDRVRELERKVDALTRAVEDLRRSLRR